MEDNVGVCSCPLIPRVVPMRYLEDLLTRAQGIPDQNVMLAVLP